MARITAPVVIALAAVGLLIGSSTGDGAFGASAGMGGIGPGTVPRGLLAILAAIALLDAIKGGLALRRIRAKRSPTDGQSVYPVRAHASRAGGVALVIGSALAIAHGIVNLDLAAVVAVATVLWLVLLRVRGVVSYVSAVAASVVLVVIIAMLTNAPVARLTV